MLGAMLTVEPHPLLDLQAFETRWPAPLGTAPSPDWMQAMATLPPMPPFSPPDDAHQKSVRELLRWGGFKPAGRGKPCWEYIHAVTSKGNFPWINQAVDATNLAVLHAALPISTVDLDRLQPPFRVSIAPPGSRYVFNMAGQEIDLSGLLCLMDADGPCSNAVKDSQRAKTQSDSTHTLTLIWGTHALPGRARAARDWQLQLHRRLGGVVQPISLA